MQDFWNENLNKMKINKKIVIIILTLIIIVATITAILLYFLNINFRNWVDINILQKEIAHDEVSVIDYNSDANVEICAYDNYIGILSKNKFDIYNNSGKQVSSLDIPINNVIFSDSNRFLGIAQNNGQNIYLVQGQNLSWENKVEGSISKISVNKNGYMAVVIADTSYKTIVSLYSPNGKELFKIYLSSTRVADVSISNDNKYLALAEIDTASSVVKSKIKIISIENAQTDTENSVIHVHNADANKLLINIKYQDRNKLLCMYDDSIDILQEQNNTQLLDYTNRKISFATVELNNGVAIVEEKSSGLFVADSEIAFINVDTKKETVYTANDVTKEIYSCDDIVAINLGEEIHFVNKGGWLVKKYRAGQEISKVVMSGSLAGILYRDKIEIIDL